MKWSKVKNEKVLISTDEIKGTPASQLLIYLQGHYYAKQTKQSGKLTSFVSKTTQFLQQPQNQISV